MIKIGLTPNVLVREEKYFEGLKKTFVSNEFIDCISRSNAVAVVFGMNDNKDIIYQQVAMVDAIILTGGGDIDPILYGQKKHSQSTVDRYRDDYEYQIIQYAMQLNKPILGVCRGLQMINVYFGGTLDQDIPSHSQSTYPHLGTHRIKIKENSWLYDILKEEYEVNSYHHQSIAEMAPGFSVDAITIDGIIEAISNPYYPIYAVQFHPEMMAKKDPLMQEIFTWFIHLVEKVSKNIETTD